jgi:hypothetical protein
MATSYDILQTDVNQMFWDKLRATPDYDPTKDEEYSESFPLIDTPECTDLNMLTTYIRKYRWQIRDGDMLQIGGAGYRNDHLAFWSHTKGVILPDCITGTDYGSIPSDFRVGNGVNEFHPLHWTKSSNFYYYDGLIWLSTELLSEIHAKLIKNAEGIYTCDVVIRGTTFQIQSKIPDPTKVRIMHGTFTIVNYDDE